MVDVLKSYKVQIVSHEEPWTEIPNEMTPLFYAFAAWAAKYESDRKSARIKAALERRKAKGLPVGRIVGAKDKHHRKRTGYLRRYADRRI
jgi:DNA invertase Pin-like site-specific DNA recombinase